jgi:menaquinone-dependent protoporphyrinogen oxidase
MAKVLIVYGTTEGHTAKVSNFIGEVGRRAGHEVDVVHSATTASDLDVSIYDLILVGASVHEGRHQKDTREWIRDHRPQLEKVPSGFFQVSMMSADPEMEREAMAVVDRMSEETGWEPSRVGLVAGALKYTEYSWLKRQLMRMIAKSRGGDTDTTSDYEYTDWSALDRWVKELFELLPKERAEVSAPH